MKDGQTHLAHKAEHAVDLESGALVAVTVQGADQGDTRTLVTTAITGVGALIQRGRRAVAGMLTIATAGGS